MNLLIYVHNYNYNYKYIISTNEQFMFKKVCIQLSILSLLLGAGYSASAQGPVRVGIFQFPPFYSKKENEKAEGLLIDIAKEKIGKIGKVASFKSFHTPVLMQQLLAGGVDVGMLIKHPALVGKTLYSDEPINTIELVAYHGVGTPSLETNMNLAGKKVLVLAGYGYGGLLKKLKGLVPKPEFIEASDIYSGLDMLLSGRGDYFLSYLKPSEEIAERKGYKAKDEWLLSDKIATFDVFWVVSKKAHKAEELLRQLEAVQ